MTYNLPIVWWEGPHSYRTVSFLCETKNGFSRGTGWIISLVVAAVSLSKPMKPYHCSTGAVLKLTLYTDLPVESGGQTWNSSFGWSIARGKTGGRCSLGYLLLRNSEVRTQGQLRTDRDSVSCSRTLQQGVRLPSCRRVPTVQGQGPRSPQHLAALKRITTNHLNSKAHNKQACCTQFERYKVRHLRRAQRAV